MKSYMYVAVRRDLSVPQQVVQACHAAIEACERYHSSVMEHPSVIVLGIKTEKKLENFREWVRINNFKFRDFHEPDRGDELTSVAVFPVTEEQQSLFRKWQLLN